MASQPLRAADLRPIPTPPQSFLHVIDAVAVLRNRIAAALGPKHDCELSISKDGIAFDLVVALPAGCDPQRAIFTLESQPIAEITFTNIDHRPAPRAVTRKLVTARIVSPEQFV